VSGTLNSLATSFASRTEHGRFAVLVICLYASFAFVLDAASNTRRGRPSQTDPKKLSDPVKYLTRLQAAARYPLRIR